MSHFVAMQPDGTSFLPICTCGWRSDKWLPRGKAEDAADKHMMDVNFLRLNTGARPTAKTAAKQYRANSENLVYSPEERTYWRMLAEELEAEVEARDKKRPIEGQLELFE